MKPGGVAFACGRGGGVMKLPPYCPSGECRRARDDAAIAKAIADGVIDP